MVGGVVVTSDDAVHEKLRFVQNSVGAVPSPFDCYMALRGLKTLHVRLEAAASNAMVRGMVCMVDCLFGLCVGGGRTPTSTTDIESHPKP